MTIVLQRHEIIQAFADYTRPPRQAELDALTEREGIPMRGLAYDPDGRGFGIGVAEIERLADGRFEFAVDVEPGEAALVVVARDHFGDAIDLVAFRRDGYLASWIGRATLLGEFNILAPRLGEPLDVYRSAFDWLRAERHGVCLIDEPRAARELREAGPFRAANVEHGLHLQALFTAPMPSIVVPQSSIPRRAA